MIRRQFKKNDIQLVAGFAEFVDLHQVKVVDEKGGRSISHFGRLLCLGDRVEAAEFQMKFHLTMCGCSIRQGFFRSITCQSRLTVLGRRNHWVGVCEFFLSLGTQVTVMDKRDHMLPLLDREIGMHLQTALTEIGLKFVGEKEIEDVVVDGEKVITRCRDSSAYESEMLLFALGRIANVDGLRLENAGISLNAKGYVPVNALFQTIVPHIYGVGDVIGGPALASTSMEQGRLAVRHAFGASIHHFSDFYPIGIYTIPEISSVGYTEEQLKALDFNYEVGRAYYYEIARNQIKGNDPGMFKILFHSDTLEILGIHIIGREATEVIHIGQVAMTFNARIDYFIDQVFNYPTYAEGYRIAALNGFNKVKHRK